MTQEIDSYNRLSQGISAELASTNSRLTEFQGDFDAHRAATRKELDGLAKEAGELKNVLGEVETSLRTQGKSLRGVTSRLDETMEKLRDLPLLGRKFRDH